MDVEFIPIGLYANPDASFPTDDRGNLHFLTRSPDTTGNPGASTATDPTTAQGQEADDEEEEEDEVDTPIVVLSFALGLEHRMDEEGGWDDESDICHCRIQMADAEGNLWETKTFFDTDVLIGHIEDWLRLNWVHPFENTEDEWKQAFEKRTLLTGIRGYYDDRFYRRLILGETIHYVPFKYQYPIFDIAFLPGLTRPANPTLEDLKFDNSKLLVRASQFRDANVDEVPPCVFELPCDTLMFHSNKRGLPVLPVFKKVGVTEQAQPLVQYSLA